MEIQNVAETGKSIMGCRPGQTLQSSHFLISSRAALLLFFFFFNSSTSKSNICKPPRVEKMTYGPR